MSISQWTTRLASLVAVLIVATVASAQHHGPARAYHDQMYQPYIDMHAFDPDYQFFAPAELDDFGNGWQAKTGWFGKYDRTYLFMTRPELEQSFEQMDPAWGHRFQLGYMTSDNHGWFVEGTDLNSPNKGIRKLFERVDRFNDDDDPNQDNNQGGGGGGGNQQDDAVFPVDDRNDPETDSRVFRSVQSVNFGTLSGFELNKTFRLKRFHNGSYLEPFLGVRYHIFNDFHRRDSYRRLDDVMGTLIPTIPQPNTTDNIEEIIISRSNWENHMIGAQMGVHWYKQIPRWQLSSDLRFFAAQNFQSLNQRTDTDYYLYASVAQGADINAVHSIVDTNFNNNDEFVWGLDVRAEAAYELTRDISLTCGFQVVHYVQGIARGNQANFNEEDLTLAGLTFGLQVNR